MLNTNRDLAETMRRAAVCLALCLVILFVSPLWAQTGRGTVIGSIMDSSGANIPGEAGRSQQRLGKRERRI